jgi:ketosteroid isomerase-like protein
MGRLFGTIGLSLLLFAAGSAQSQEQKSEIQSSILSVMDAQAAAWNRGDIEGYMRGYWNSERLVFVSGDNVTRGWAPTLERYKRSYDTREKMGSLKFGDVVIEVISKDAATVLGSWSLTRAKDNPKGKFTLIFRKFKDGWRIVHDHTS